MSVEAMTDDIARLAPYANTNSEGEYTGDIYADDDEVSE